MFPKCYSDSMNAGYRPIPVMPKPYMFPAEMAPGTPMQDSGMGEMKMVPGTTSSGAPTPGGMPGPTPSHFEMAPGSPVMQDTQYTQGYLRTQIGKRVRVTFLLGTNTLQDRTGILKKVGISYIVLREPDTNTDVVADIYSIKFVDIFPTAPVEVSEAP